VGDAALFHAFGRESGSLALNPFYIKGAGMVRKGFEFTDLVAFAVEDYKLRLLFIDYSKHIDAEAFKAPTRIIHFLRKSKFKDLHRHVPYGAYPHLIKLYCGDGELSTDRQSAKVILRALHSAKNLFDFYERCAWQLLIHIK
jgi:hypothetical protein